MKVERIEVDHAMNFLGVTFIYALAFAVIVFVGLAFIQVCRDFFRKGGKLL